MLHYNKKILCFFISFLLLGVSTTIVNADHTYKTSIVKKVLPAVVEVHAERVQQSAKDGSGFQFRGQPQSQQPPVGQRNQQLGSGFVISDDGYILTNAHVVSNVYDSGTIRVIFFDDKEYKAELVNYDQLSDIALLKITNAEFNKKFEFLSWGRTPELGQDVFAIGSPMGQSFTVTFGNVSSLNRFIPNVPSFVPFIQTDASINPGNSGGPLMDNHGDVVGINTMIITGNGNSSGGSVGIGFAIDGDYALMILAELKKGGKIQRPYMGIMFRPVEKEDMEDYSHGIGAYVQEVVKGSPATGILKVGDIILSMDGEAIKWKLLATKVKSKKIGEIAKLIILRDGMEIPIDFVMGVMQ